MLDVRLKLGSEQRTWQVMISGCAESRFPESFGLLVRERDGGVAGAAAGEAGDGTGQRVLRTERPSQTPSPRHLRGRAPRGRRSPPPRERAGGRQRGWRPRRGRPPWPRELRPK